jgi:hypothetical protein
VKGGLIAGTLLSLIVVGFWSAAGAATANPMPPLHLSRHHLLASYWALASAPTGNGLELLVVVAVIYALCLFAGLYRRERRAREV